MPVMRILLPLLLLLLATAPAALAAERPLELRTLKLKERLRHPRYVVEVGPDKPLAIRGRAKPVAFALSGDALRVDADGDGTCETPVADGRPVKLALDRGDEKRTVAFLAGDPTAGSVSWSAVSLDALAGKLGGTSLLFLDHDADGTWLTPWRDFLVTKGGAEYQPVAGCIVLGKQAIRLGPNEKERVFTAREDREFGSRDVFKDWSSICDGLEHLNRIRAGMNILPVTLNRDATHGALLHLRYCARNGENGHLEEEGKPGYTREGLAAGLNSIGYQGPLGIVGAIDGHLGSLLHRMELIDPTITEIGIAVGSGRVWIHTESKRRRMWEGQGPFVFPGPGRSWRVGIYAGDNPDPRPKGVTKATGLPITCAWYGDAGVRRVSAELRSAGGAVPCWRNDSAGRELVTNRSELRATLMPKDPLRSGRYRLILTWFRGETPCRLEHEFTIGGR
jgi:hypothetical protein